jgi:ABC-2 type transport system ATP-binding protein
MIRTENLTKSFGGGRGVDNVNLDVPRGAIYGFVGRNGAGKTTTIKMLCGLLRQDSGRAFIGDLEVLPKNISKIKSLIGYMPDITGVYEQMSVWEFLDFYGAAFKIAPKLRGGAHRKATLAITKASHMIDYQMTLPLSGMRQRVGLAQDSWVHDPEIVALILDEPAGGLDRMGASDPRCAAHHPRRSRATRQDLILLSSHILPWSWPPSATWSA